MTDDEKKAQALKLVTRATRKLNKARREQKAAIRYANANEGGDASYREIAAATEVDGDGISHQQVKRIVEREEEETVEGTR